MKLHKANLSALIVYKLIFTSRSVIKREKENEKEKINIKNCYMTKRNAYSKDETSKLKEQPRLLNIQQLKYDFKNS